MLDRIWYEVLLLLSGEDSLCIVNDTHDGVM